MRIPHSESTAVKFMSCLVPAKTSALKRYKFLKSSNPKPKVKTVNKIQIPYTNGESDSTCTITVYCYF